MTQVAGYGAACRRGVPFVRTVVAAVLTSLAAACGDEPDFLEPNLGDFVQATTPDAGAVVPADKSGTISVFLNFLPAEGRFGFGVLRSFRFDGDEYATASRSLRAARPGARFSPIPPRYRLRRP